MPGQDLRQAPEGAKGSGRVSWPGGLDGAYGDLGTFLPLAVGATTAAGLAPAGVLVGFGVLLVTVGLPAALARHPSAQRYRCRG